MGDAPSSTRVAGPRHLVGGRWRASAERASVALAIAPGLAALTLSAAALVLVSVLVAALVLITFASAVVCWPIGRRWARRAYWRTRWWWDARAGLLALNAEQNLTGSDTGAVDVAHVVVVPFVRRLDVLPAGRRYLLRPLPTQTVSTFEDACGRLAQRWGAASVTVEHTIGSRDLALIVSARLPESRPWTR